MYLLESKLVRLVSLADMLYLENKVEKKTQCTPQNSNPNILTTNNLNYPTSFL